MKAPSASLPILIVDDYPLMLQMLRSYLDRIGLRNVAEARNGQQALAMLQSKPFGLVISDWNMTPMSGLALLQEIRKDEKLAGLPYIMITSNAAQVRVQEARDAGADNFLVKPFNWRQLQAKIEFCLAEKRNASIPSEPGGEQTRL